MPNGRASSAERSPTTGPPTRSPAFISNIPWLGVQTPAPKPHARCPQHARPFLLWCSKPSCPVSVPGEFEVPRACRNPAAAGFGLPCDRLDGVLVADRARALDALCRPDPVEEELVERINRPFRTPARDTRTSFSSSADFRARRPPPPRAMERHRPRPEPECHRPGASRI